MVNLVVIFQQLVKQVVEKSNFLEKLGINNFFGNLAKTEWISGIDIDEKRKTKI